MTIDSLLQIILDRKSKRPQGSYVASLFEAGQDRIIQKIGEEATEVVIAGKNESKERLISEIADLTFHVLILMASTDITPDNISAELEKRSV